MATKRTASRRMPFLMPPLLSQPRGAPASEDEALLAQGADALEALTQEAVAARAEADRLALEILLARATQGDVQPLRTWLQSHSEPSPEHLGTREVGSKGAGTKGAGANGQPSGLQGESVEAEEFAGGGWAQLEKHAVERLRQREEALPLAEELPLCRMQKAVPRTLCSPAQRSGVRYHTGSNPPQSHPLTDNQGGQRGRQQVRPSILRPRHLR